ncbi:hypothetical protein A2526_01670 [candidate division WOR-1 bacterium RIFOXYD2_FULL_36_8]|uniref:Uncharacterized protein n=1 Tax=candidate division WOR-1 bacterium RIFOXYB2_FULL_36_35 TaxID=1802578 RepID=A0A1F4S2R8_UNCSA|nr:MAG: hypothetical protein A2230_04570 [candidate division WOR-1 bacterium RIFOXYA2_FULL_36_21]OGC14667.1 MAG: hypothetical protein A2290_01300 [candidate division WOR-1 bacterium RIFOXYB2_FULL_36_35]OGC19685.1 MAG: hypothetical protein A2282_03025 [candidate division WOR-1 bacterium RIFOXYA12_FULL_36_13]OGC38996.1 MAG: hypothetical protein A2526_01670 [candidate division WOR-1 bacterium RIFOXYD2_FULL_36_8]
MNKYFIVLLGVISFSFLVGCGRVAEVISGLADDTAQEYAMQSSSMSQDIYASVAEWANSGEISGLNLSDINMIVIVTPETSGWYHITGTNINSSIDLHVKLAMLPNLQASNLTKTVYLYGTYTYIGSNSTIVQTYGDSVNNFTAETMWSLATSTLQQISLDGQIRTNVIGAAGNTTVMSLTVSSLSLPLTETTNYPIGAITVNTSYDNEIQPAIVLTFNGTSTVSFQYDTTIRTFTIKGVSI